MTQPQSIYDESQGRPNLAVLQFLQDNWGRDEISAATRVAIVRITADASVTPVAADIPVGAEIMNVIVHATATNASGTALVQVGGGGSAITDAIAMDTLNTKAEAVTIVQTEKVVTTDGVEVTTNGAADKGDVYIYYKKSV